MTDFEWTTHPAAESLVDRLLDEAVSRSAELRAWAAAVEGGTATRLVDWLDHLVSPVDAAELKAAGFGAAEGVWRHDGAQLPGLVASDDGVVVVAVRVDDADAFAAVNGAAPAEGAPLSAYRRATLELDGGVLLRGVERRSWSAGMEPSAGAAADAVEFLTAWLTRRRSVEISDGFTALNALAASGVAALGGDIAASLAMQAERQYWEARNRAARWQRARQDAYGLGWGNHDHHTFRCSREWFAPLLDVLHTLGFQDREKFHAGDAGWGAQVLEQPGAGLVVFADVDLEPNELDIDALSARDELGTVGLWCALHGESALQAGMHHLEGTFDFDALSADLDGAGFGLLPPFSNFPHLRQAFTAAELWPVAADHLAALVAAGQLTAERAAEISVTGAPGSHLENLARRGGFKGFNQHAVSDIITRTDARTYTAP